MLVSFLCLQAWRSSASTLGGKLTVLLLKDLGTGEDVHFMDTCLLQHCIKLMKDYASDDCESARAKLFTND